MHFSITLKGLCHDIFLKLNQSALSVRGCLSVGKIKNKDCACYYEKPIALTKILPEILFRKLVLASRPCPKILKIAPKPACDLEKCSESWVSEKIDQ
jgi:hypothetical protein